MEVRTDEMLSDGEASARSASIEEIIRTLDTRTTQQAKAPEDILKAAKTALNQYLQQL